MSSESKNREAVKNHEVGIILLPFGRPLEPAQRFAQRDWGTSISGFCLPIRTRRGGVAVGGWGGA